MPEDSDGTLVNETGEAEPHALVMEAVVVVQEADAFRDLEAGLFNKVDYDLVSQLTRVLCQDSEEVAKRLVVGNSGSVVE